MDIHTILGMLPKEVLLFIIGGFIALFIWVFKLIKMQFQEQSKLFRDEHEQIKKDINEIKTDLKKNTSLTNSCIYNDLDTIVHRGETYGVWSSSIAQSFEELYKRYIDAGDGIDGGANLRKRADAIEINDKKYIELMNKYYQHKKEMIEH